jgi:hypothetical protein
MPIRELSSSVFIRVGDGDEDPMPSSRPIKELSSSVLSRLDDGDDQD